MKCLAFSPVAVGLLLLAGCSPGVSNSRQSRESADAYPRKTVTIICPWAAGGGTDRVARFWSGALSKRLGKPFVVVNRTGGAGATGHSAGAKARPDGYTITIVTFELATMHRLGITDLTYEDFDFLVQVNADAAAIVVRSDSPWKSMEDWIEHLRAKPGAIKMSGTATGGAWDLARAGLMMAADLPLDSVIWVPKEGAAPSMIELLGGHLDAVCCSVPEAAAQIDGGQVRVLGVMSDERLKDYPEVPTARESGYDWSAVVWRGLALPKGAPPAIIAKLEEACLAVAESDDFREFMATNRFGVDVKGASDFAEFVKQQDEQWKTVVEAASK